MMTHEDESPMTAHRSVFDTERCPPPADCHVVPADARFHLTRAGKEKLAELGLVERVSANGRAAFPVVVTGSDGKVIPPGACQVADFYRDIAHKVLDFAGGPVELPKPTRADLVLSAQQWATRAREELFELANNAASPETRLTGYRAITGALNRLDAVLKELADAET
jgi:hypothetical protein